MFNKNIGMLLLGIWLIIMGLSKFIPAIEFNGFAIVMALLAIVSGILLTIQK